MKGKFIVIEGIDGCGKSTQIDELSKWLPNSGLIKKGSKLITTREPGGSLLGKKLRRMILDNNENNKPSSLAELLLYSADRAEHVSKIISPALNNNDWVISDRFSDSTLAYQGYGRNINLEIIKNIEWLLSKGIIIDSDAKKVIENEETKTNTIIGVSIKDKLLGFILLGDLLRDDSIKTVQNLRENKFKISILSGDRKQTVLALAKKIGFKETEVKWDLLPEMKLKTIENLKINNKVAMIGDGINDVPALASSDLGIAVGSGTQIAKANADVVLMGDQLNGLPYALNLAKKTIRKIKQNLTWAFGYNLLAIPLAAGILFPKYGILLTPSIAALLMAISSITVVINALSLD